MTRRHRWTREEVETLCREYRNNKQSVIELAVKLGVTEKAVQSKVSRLGLCRSSQWTPEENRLLFDLVGRNRPQTIARKLDRSLKAVASHARKLGLSLRERHGWYTQEEVAEILGCRTSG